MVQDFVHQQYPEVSKCICLLSWLGPRDASFLDQLEIDDLNIQNVDVEIGAGKSCVTLDLVNVGILTLDCLDQRWNYETTGPEGVENSD